MAPIFAFVASGSLQLRCSPTARRAVCNSFVRPIALPTPRRARRSAPPFRLALANSSPEPSEDASNSSASGAGPTGPGGGEDIDDDAAQTTAASATGPAAAAAVTVSERPAWAPRWLPTWFDTIAERPWAQLAILLPLYAIHLFFFSTKGWKFKQPLIPNSKNLFQSIGYDSVVGAIVAIVFFLWRNLVQRPRLQAELARLEAEAAEGAGKGGSGDDMPAVAAATTAAASTSTTATGTAAAASAGDVADLEDDSARAEFAVKPVFENLLRVDRAPWKVPREAKRRIGQTTLLLVVAYLASGYGAVFSEQILYLLAGFGVPLTVATTRAWKVLLGHLMWVYMGVRILRRLSPFFPPRGTWLRWRWRANWVWWAIGGYYVSALLFNVADVVNQVVLPSSLFEEETVVSKLINPENKDRWAMAIGSIGPCVSAPVFEEVLYRGFLLPALACFLPMWAAIPMSSVLFAIHHLNPTMVLPLSMLGFIWAILYAKSRNLLVTILIHAMWNSRVFLGSLLGLGTFTDFE